MSGTYLFRKTGPAWKGTYFQESGLAPAPVKPAKPGK